MKAEERMLAQAASRLTVQDFQYLQGHGMLLQAGAETQKPSHLQEAVSGPETISGEASSQDKADFQVRKKRKRCSRKHAWPEPGTILEADYFGTRYEAEVIQEGRFKSGKALRILSGPAAGQVYHSLSGAMLAATENQRQEQGLGRRGVSNGWTFWMKGQTNAKRT